MDEEELRSLELRRGSRIEITLNKDFAGIYANEPAMVYVDTFANSPLTLGIVTPQIGVGHRIHYVDAGLIARIDRLAVEFR